jgi:hypothetical protein
MATKIRPNKMFRLLTMLVLLPASLMVILAWTDTDESIAQLRLDHAALRAAEDDYRAQRGFGLDGTDATEYASYIARLQRRVFEDCKAVSESGSSIPPDLPCPVNLPQENRSADIATETEYTPQEQIAALDSMLNAGMGEYDEKLLREQDRIKAATPNDNSDGGGQGGADGAGDGGSQGEGDSDSGSEGEGSAGGSDGEGQEGGGRTGGDNQAGDAGDRRSGGPQDGSTGSGEEGSDNEQPADIPDGSNDDVVARQLREAAEKETDPELKAKLWEEYRRYKRGTS